MDFLLIYDIAKWVFIFLDFLLGFAFVFLLWKTRSFWENPRLYYPWERKRLLKEEMEKESSEENQSS